MGTRHAPTDSDDELNPRPLKRQRLSSSSPSPSSSLSSCPSPTTLRPLPPVQLLLSLPGLVVHPPSHRHHIHSLAIARQGLKQCLGTRDLEPGEECRAWTGLAELGMMWVDAVGEGIGEVEMALTKALLLSQKHPALRLYTPHLTILSARLAQNYQGNSKFAATTLRRLLTSLTSSSAAASTSSITPLHVIFGAHLALIHTHCTSAEDESASSAAIAASSTKKGKLKAPTGTASLQKCLAAIQDMHAAAVSLSCSSGIADSKEGCSVVNLVVLFTLVLRLQLLVRHGLWENVGDVLGEAERAFDAYEKQSSSSVERASTPTPASTTPIPPKRELILDSDTGETIPPIPPSLRVHLLVLAVTFYTYAGDADKAADRLKALHTLLDTGVLTTTKGKAWEAGMDGVINIPFPGENSTAPPLRIQATPPRVLHALAFLLSAVAKRDPVGRAPKKAVFAKAGLELWEGKGRSVFGGPEWSYGASNRERERERTRMERIKADLMTELVAISIMRSEYEVAEQNLNELTSHLREHGLWDMYAARMVLMYAQLAHAKGHTERAVKCYQVAGWVASRGPGGGGADSTLEGNASGGGGGEIDEWVRTAAHAGEIWVRVGVLRKRSAERNKHSPPHLDRDSMQEEPTDDTHDEIEMDEDMWNEMNELRVLGKEVVRECEGRGGALRAVGEVIRASLVEEVLSSKQHLRLALDLATQARDNHLRALVLALVASHYQHTAREHAVTMLGTCAQLAAGLGAGKKNMSAPLAGAGAETGEAKASGEGNSNVGNAQLRLWVGERIVELHRWAGEGEKAGRQENVNKRIREVVDGGV